MLLGRKHCRIILVGDNLYIGFIIFSMSSISFSDRLFMYDKSIAANLSFAAIIIYSNIYSYLQEPLQEGIRKDKLLFAEGELDVDELVGFANDHSCTKLWVQYAAVHIERSQLGSQGILGFAILLDL